MRDVTAGLDAVSTRRAIQPLLMEVEMIEQSCPWCESKLHVELRVMTEDDSQTCPECLTTWTFEDESVYELALAA